MEQNNFDKYVMCLEQMTQEKKEVCEKTVQAIYDKYLDHPLSHKAHELLHTRYFVKRKK